MLASPPAHLVPAPPHPAGLHCALPLTPISPVIPLLQPLPFCPASALAPPFTSFVKITSAVPWREERRGRRQPRGQGACCTLLSGPCSQETLGPLGQGRLPVSWLPREAMWAARPGQAWAGSGPPGTAWPTLVKGSLKSPCPSGAKYGHMLVPARCQDRGQTPELGHTQAGG